MTSIPIVEKTDKHISFMVLGRQIIGPALSNQARVRLKKLGADPEKICEVVDPSKHTPRLVMVANYQSPVAAGGVLLTEPRSVAVIHSCVDPVVILFDPITRKIVLCRASLPALVPEKCSSGPCYRLSIIGDSIQMLVGIRSPKNLEAFVIKGICRTCRRQDEAHDAHELISAELAYAGVPRGHVTQVGHCMAQDNRMASGLMHPKQTNTVVVILH